MRELERNPESDIPPCSRLAIVGRGRLGEALSAQLRATNLSVEGPLGRGADGAQADAVLLCVPDSEIAGAAALIPAGKLVGHCSGATGLDVLAPHEAFSLHPLMTVTPAGADFRGAGAAVAGTTSRALELATGLATRLAMRPITIADADRPLYHAAASMASNFLVTLEAWAERIGTQAGIDRAMLAPLVRATVENWVALGGERALTGPVARRDWPTVQAQRDALHAREPQAVGLFDTLVAATLDLVPAP